MLRSICLGLAVCAAGLAGLAGCGKGSQQWEVAVENKSDGPCSFFVTLGNGTANVENVDKGKTLTLIVGEVKTVVQTVKVVRGKDEQTLTPKADLPVGKRYLIIVGADGKVETSVADR